MADSENVEIRYSIIHWGQWRHYDITFV